MALKLQRLQALQPIVDAQGRPTNQFQRFWQANADTIESHDSAQDASLAGFQSLAAQLQSALAAVSQAQQTANKGGAGAGASGSATTVSHITTTLAAGPDVTLTGLAAGNFTASVTLQTDYTLSILTGGTLVAQGGSGVGGFAQYAASGEFDIVEDDGTPATLYTGTFTVNNYRSFSGSGTTITIDDPAALSAFTSARTNTGTVDYILKLKMTTPGSDVTNVTAYLFAHRS